MHSFLEKSFIVEACIWERPNINQEIKIATNSTIYCKKIPVASKNKIRGGAIISGLELIQEFFQGFIFILLKRPNVIIIQNHRQFLHLFSAFIYKILNIVDVKIVWDLREIPNGFENYRITRFIFSKLCAIPDFIWVMNNGRMNHIILKYQLSYKNFHVVPNYCELKYWDAPKDPLNNSIQSFLKRSTYVYVQNPFNKERYGFNSIASVLYETDNKVICSGHISGDLKIQLCNQFGEEFISERVLFTGSLQESQLKSLIDNCKFSIILYDSSIINNYYCDANRLYQCISRDIPVIVGINPGLSDYVHTYNLGLITKDDGSNINYLRQVVRKLESKLEQSMVNDFTEARENMAWEQNKSVFDLLG